MSIEFRQRTPAEYLNILRRRKWLIILPVIAVTAAVSWVVYRLPDVYESTTLIVVRPSTLPTSVVGTGNEDNITRQLNGIAQVVTSRSSLEPLVDKYDLYGAERQRGEPMESIISMVRRDIKVEVNTSRNDITNGFNITFHGRYPKVTRDVTSELAGKYISEQARNQQSSGTAAKTFIDSQVRQATVGHLASIRTFVGGLAAGAGAADPDALARKWHILMKGSIVAAGEGDAQAARRAQEIGRLLLADEGIAA